MSEGAIEAFNVIGQPTLLVDALVLVFRDDTDVRFIQIRIKSGFFSVTLGDLLPQLAGSIAVTRADMEGNDLPCGDIQGNPDPLLVVFAAVSRLKVQVVRQVAE